MSQFIVNDGIKTTLASAITSTSTTITLSSSANLPTLLPGQIIPLVIRSASSSSAFEVVYGTAITGANVTVQRGMEGTAAQAFNVGDFVLCGPTSGSNALITAVMTPAQSQTLPQAYGAVVFPSGLSGATTLTLPNSVPAGTSYVIYGASGYAVTVSTNATSGSPFIALSGGAEVYSWTIPANNSEQGINLDFDGTNWRGQPFGGSTSTGGFEQQYATNTTITSSVSFTAPCDGWVYASGSRNNNEVATAQNAATLYINGTVIMSDTTFLSISHSGAVSVSAGTACTVSYEAACDVAFSCNVSAVFVPSTGGAI